ncbi:unnamed protein product, partial [Rotaria sp. Silwood1]
MLPERYPNQVIAYSNIGNVHRFMGDYKMALTFHQKALNIQKNVQCNPLEYATTMTMKNVQRAIEIARDKLSSNHPHLLNYEETREEIRK